MESIQSRLSLSAMAVNLRIFTEPRGLIRALQFIFAIFAFAIACSGSSSATFSLAKGNDSIQASWSYPYDLKNSPMIINSTNNLQQTISDSNSAKPSAEFFVFIGVTSMLLSLAFCIIYIFFDRPYRNDWRFSMIDFVITIIWSIFWIAGSAAWAKGVSDIRSQTSLNALVNRSALCDPISDCKAIQAGSYGSIISSVIFGFLNFVLWLGSAWFVFKETKFFKSRTEQQQQQQSQQSQAFPPTSFSNMSSPTMEHEPQFR
ncbi:unnamed protein product [Rotaria magnacalcarata]|uniref:MARVEL domain-containing protein n=1 Tax=Rotaria magnacalcarata TaxID=392030 RepID=A0A816YZ18_9BILA|nr:unnamed protein product [Rotaria magnacalcarata]